MMCPTELTFSGYTEKRHHFHLIRNLLTALVAITLIAFAPAIIAQQTDDASISGRVVHPGTQNYLSGVLLRIKETGATTSSADDGSFRFGNLAAGSYTIESSYLGLEPAVEQVTLSASQDARVTLQIGSDSIDEIVATGIRGAQAAALNEQRTNDNITNVISSDQLGRFPDRNIAEAMRRIPGVSIEREEKAGDGRYVSIRGLDSGLNNFKLNGMNVAQQEEDNRRVPLDVIQVEAVSKITVNKTLLPNHDGDGIGGSVELVSATAFDLEDNYFDVTAEGFYNDFKDDLGGKISGTFSTLFGIDEKWGVVLSAAYSDRSTAGYGLLNDEDWVAVIEQDDDEPLESGNSPEVYDFGALRIDNDRENLGVNMAISLRASEQTTLHLKGSYNKLDDTEFDRGIFFVGDDDELYQGGVFDPEGGYTARIIGEYEESEFESQSYILLGETQHKRWRFNYSAGLSEGFRDEPNDYEISFEKDMVTSPILWDRSNNEFPSPELDPADEAAIADPSGWALSGNDIDADRAEDEKQAFTFDATLDTSGSGPWQYFKAGVKFQSSDRSLFEANVLEADGDLFFEEDGWRGEDIDFSDVGNPYGSVFAIDRGMLSNWRQIGFDLVADGTLDNDYEDDGVIPADEDTYTATEDILSGYVMAQANVGKWEFIGGVRIEQTDVSVRNLELTEDEDAGTETLMRIKTNTDYTEVLPRLQVNYRASDDVVYRGAAFASLARPEFQFIAGTTEIEIEDGTADIFLGNPALKAAYAWNFDFGVEFYFGGIGIFSANVFYKTIDDFIFNDDAPEGDGDPSQFENDPRFAGLTIGDVETYINGDKADIYGLELNYIRQFTDASGIWSNFGTYLNLTLQESSADSGLDGRDDEEFFNAPNTIGTAALTYQSERFQANLAYSYRDKFLFGFSQFQESIYEQDYDSLDVTLNYDVTDRIRLLFRASDITDSGTKAIVHRTFGGGSSFLENSNYNGRNFSFGVNARF